VIRVLVVDDESPARARLQRLLRDHADVECVGAAGDGVSALGKVRELDPDVVFLDVAMPEMTGLEVAAAMPKPGPLVVFVTAFDEHAVRAFDLAAADYLLKPVTGKRLATTLARIRDRSAVDRRPVVPAIAAREKPRKMAVRCGAKYDVFDVERVAAIVARDHYASILVDGRELLSDESLDRLLERLDETRFVRVHRSAIVNLSFVRELQQEGDRKYLAILSEPNVVRIPVSRERLDDFKRRLGIEDRLGPTPAPTPPRSG
jgi:two-component system LytT family response regulator